MLSGFSSYIFGGNTESQVQTTDSGSVSAANVTDEHNDWVLLENPGK